jgi:hypothetical protein
MNDRVLARKKPDMSIVLKVFYIVATLSVLEARSQEKAATKRRRREGLPFSQTLDRVHCVYSEKKAFVRLQATFGHLSILIRLERDTVNIRYLVQKRPDHHEPKFCLPDFVSRLYVFRFHLIDLPKLINRPIHGFAGPFEVVVIFLFWSGVASNDDGVG